MSSIVDSLPWLCLIALAGISFIVGVILLVAFARSRKIRFLIPGLLLTFIFPGILLCLAVILWIPNAVMVYGPPPPNYSP